MNSRSDVMKAQPDCKTCLCPVYICTSDGIRCANCLHTDVVNMPSTASAQCAELERMMSL